MILFAIAITEDGTVVVIVPQDHWAEHQSMCSDTSHPDLIQAEVDLADIGYFPEMEATYMPIEEKDEQMMREDMKKLGFIEWPVMAGCP